MLETEDRTSEHESPKEESSISSEEKSKDSKKSKPLGQKIMSGLRKIPIFLMAALLLAIGGPVGIVLSVLLLGFLARKPLFKMAKKGANLFKRRLITRKKRSEERSKLGRVTKTSTLEMDKQSLRSMGTRPDGVSVIKLPEDQSRATSNGDKLSASKFKHLGQPQVKLSKAALKRRNSSPSRIKSNPLAKSKSVPNLKRPSPALKLK